MNSKKDRVPVNHYLSHIRKKVIPVHTRSESHFVRLPAGQDRNNRLGIFHETITVGSLNEQVNLRWYYLILFIFFHNNLLRRMSQPVIFDQNFHWEITLFIQEKMCLKKSRLFTGVSCQISVHFAISIQN